MIVYSFIFIIIIYIHFIIFCKLSHFCITKITRSNTINRNSFLRLRVIDPCPFDLISNSAPLSCSLLNLASISRPFTFQSGFVTFPIRLPGFTRAHYLQIPVLRILVLYKRTCSILFHNFIHFFFRYREQV